MLSMPLDPQWFADEDFRFRLGTVPGSAEDFFAWSADAAEVLAERRRWLTTDTDRYAALLPEGTEIAEELFECVADWPMLRDLPTAGAISPMQRMLALSHCWEPDFVLLAPHAGSANEEGGGEPVFTVVGGCVCFPSGWRLTDKLRQPVEQVHQPVPGLNQAIGSQIDRLLIKLRPGKCVVRANWGVCRSPELNQHPDRHLPALESPVRMDEVGLRREDQCLFALPRTGGIVFGIRISHTSWSELRANKTVAQSVARGLRTMPDGMLDYKRLLPVCEELARLLVEY